MKIHIILFVLLFLLSNTALSAERPINEIPMYGGADKSHIEPNKDFSEQAARLGWEYLLKGDYDTAIKRFNQAWMFNHNNINALWGFGIVMAYRANFEEPEMNFSESIKYLNMASDLSANNGRILSDLAYSHALLGNQLKLENKKSEKEFSKSEELFLKASIVEPELPIIWGNWSIL